MKIDVDLPKFDIPKDFIVGDGIMGDILNMYGLFPCKIKAGVFAFCTRGTIRVTINLDEHTARANDFITLLPNTFIQIHEVSEDAEVCFVAFSSRFLESINFIRTISNLIVTIIENPVVPLSGNAAAIYKDFFSLLVRADNAPDSILFTDSLKPVLDLLIQGVVNMYRRFNTWKEPVLSRDKEIAREFVQLVWQYYTKERGVDFYADKLCLSPKYLSALSKSICGYTVQELVFKSIIRKSISLLKNTQKNVQEISDFFNFPNASYFGTFFKKQTGMSPQQYRRT